MLFRSRAGALTWFAASKLRKVVSTEAGVLGGVWLVSDEPPPPQATTIETVAPSTASVDKRGFTGKPFRQKVRGRCRSAGGCAMYQELHIDAASQHLNKRPTHRKPYAKCAR